MIVHDGLYEYGFPWLAMWPWLAAIGDITLMAISGLGQLASPLNSNDSADNVHPEVTALSLHAEQGNYDMYMVK